MSALPPLHQLVVATFVGVGTAYYCFNEPLKEWNRVQHELAEERRLEQAGLASKQPQTSSATNSDKVEENIAQ